MGALVPLIRRPQLVVRTGHRLPAALRQLDLVLDDARLEGMTTVERQAAIRALARLVLEASGITMWEGGDDNA
jgi:hypothetical protein